MNNLQKFWVRAALVNLCIVGSLGMIMRYKIGFAFPFFEQKFLQEAHSHFAFMGWISHTLYFLVVRLFKANLENINERRYTWLIITNLVWSFGMLISFAIQGYGPVSITFSSLSLITGYVFAFFGMRDAFRLAPYHPGKNWILGAIVLGVLSTTGTIVLSYMMATRRIDQTTYLASIYFYLHFQYNGWFLFACIGLFLDKIKEAISNLKPVRISFMILFVASIPAYFLSTLWAKLPLWLYALVVTAAFLQLIGWWYFIRVIRAALQTGKMVFQKPAGGLFVIVVLAFTLKVLLQFISTFPGVSDLAFGFRPIVIAYLHLVLLLIISVFLLTFLFDSGLFFRNALSRISLLVFVAAVILNEIVLATQGIAAFSYTVIPFVDQVLFGIAFVLWSSAIFLLISQFNNEYRNRHVAPTDATDMPLLRS